MYVSFHDKQVLFCLGMIKLATYFFFIAGNLTNNDKDAKAETWAVMKLKRRKVILISDVVLSTICNKLKCIKAI